MGNKLILLSSAKGYSFYQYYSHPLTPNLEGQTVISIEERCGGLDTFIKFGIGRHSYLILTTSSGDKIRVDYNEAHLEPTITYDYYELNASEDFRYAKLQKPMEVSEALRIVRKHCVKESYNVIFHNCQHVSRDAFSEISGEPTNLLRDDYIE